MNQSRRIALLAGAGTAVGFAAGYFASRAQLKAKYDGLLQEEIASVKEAYKVVRQQPFSTPEEAVEALVPEVIPTPPENALALLDQMELGKIVEYNKYSVLTPQPDEGESPLVEELQVTNEPAKENVFDKGEVPDPIDHDKPYIIATEEFMAEKDEYEKITLTYYDGDDTLCDEREQIVPDIEATVGQANLLKFDEQEDPNTIYIRNESVETDFEVVKETGSYSIMVLGLNENYLEHQEQRRPRKARWDG